MNHHSQTLSFWQNLAQRYTHRALLLHDVTLLLIMMVLAGCGLIYEFLLSHYAARVLGATELAIFAVFTVMIAAMGLGSFAAARIRQPFTGFAWLELAIGIIGATAILLIAGVITLTTLLPQVIADTYGIHSLPPEGGLIRAAQKLSLLMPYGFAFILGALIGAEIPLIARVREQIYGKYLQHNTGTIYGADYIGAGIGALLFVLFLLQLDVALAAVLAASANLVMGLIFFFRYRSHIRGWRWLAFGHCLAALIIITIGIKGPHWEEVMEDLLYKDKVIYSMTTVYQRVVVTKRIMNPNKPPIYSLFINGHTQFSSRDEKIYHAMLTYPAMAASARHNQVLIIGGGDGLALRDVLRWNPQHVTLVDLDPQIVHFFSRPYLKDGQIINTPLLELNQHAFADPRVELRFGDAFLTVDELLAEDERYDTIIIDLPDPNHPDLNKLYSARFYARLFQLLAGDGALVTQSTSPYHAPEAFISIGKTLRYAGFPHVDQYHANVPSFGEWGWSIATRNGASALSRLRRLPRLPREDSWLTRDLLLGAFAFNRGFFDSSPAIQVNRVNSTILYDYYRLGWQRETDS